MGYLASGSIWRCLEGTSIGPQSDIDAKAKRIGQCVWWFVDVLHKRDAHHPLQRGALGLHGCHKPLAKKRQRVLTPVRMADVHTTRQGCLMRARYRPRQTCPLWTWQEADAGISNTGGGLHLPRPLINSKPHYRLTELIKRGYWQWPVGALTAYVWLLCLHLSEKQAEFSTSKWSHSVFSMQSSWSVSV